VFDHFACYPVISWTFVVLQFFHGLLYFFYQYITLAVGKWWRDRRYWRLEKRRSLT